MPSMAALRHKRNYGQLDNDVDGVGIHLPSAKRQCVYHDEFSEESIKEKTILEIVPEINISSHLNRAYPKVHGIVSVLFKESCPSHATKTVPTSFASQSHNNFDQENTDTSVGIKTNSDNSEFQAFKNSFMKHVQDPPYSSDSSDADSEGSECKRTSIPKSKIQNPTLALTRVNQTSKGTPHITAPSSSTKILPHEIDVIQGGYVHRMAYLNAKACVSAHLESEKRHSRAPMSKKKNISKSVTKVTGRRITATNKKSVNDKQDLVVPSIRVHTSNLNPLKDAICGSGVRFQASVEEIPIVSNSSLCREDALKVPYNKLGVLYNGDTIYPHARVFYTQSVNRELQLPKFVVPTLVPSRLSTVKRLTTKAASFGVQHPHRKKAKQNNGWYPLGEPIKVINNNKKLSRSCIKFYAGITRKDEVVCVRDCVVIKAGTDDDGNPYVAKVGSIWQEPNGSLMMTLFWYYKSSDAEVRSAGVKCVEKELLASQHHDMNSVECIEDKCYVLGYSQYCRYRASVIKSTSTKPNSWASSNSILCHPRTASQLTTSNVPSSDFNQSVELHKKWQQVQDLGPFLSELQDVDPSLVFLCYRGFNHISGYVMTEQALDIEPVVL